MLPVLLVAAAVFARPAAAATIHVPASRSTLRAAIAAATNGDTVLIAPGSYDGGAFVNGKAITVASYAILGGDTTYAAQTVLRGVVGDVCAGTPGCGGNAVLEFGDNASGSRVVGLTISNGENGVSSASTVDLIQCRVLNNGDGVDFVSGAGGTIRDGLFADNSDDGIDLNGHMSVAIRNNVIRGNQDDGIEYRLYAYSGPLRQIEIVGNQITGNGEDGIQLIDYPAVSNLVVRIEANHFTGNFDATGMSAAVACMPDGQTIETLAGAPMAERVYLINNTITGEQNGMVGGANVVALNNIFSGILGRALRRVSGGSIASYNLFWKNGVDHEETIFDLAHAVHADPVLDFAGRLTPTSPAIDAGTAYFEWQGTTVLSRSPSSYAGAAPDLGAIEYAANTPPSVSAGQDHSVLLASDLVELGRDEVVPLRGDALLNGTVSDDGRPGPGGLAVTWSLVNGPAPVSFEDPYSAHTRATFTTAGTYFLRLTAGDGELTSADAVMITVIPPANQPPTVDAGTQQTIVLESEPVEVGHATVTGERADAVLDGLVIDDGQPGPPALTVLWTLVSGPAAVAIEDAQAIDTRATFVAPGTYVLQLTASDGELSATDAVTITVLPVPNAAPQVEAGADQTITLPADAALDGTVLDDGRPSPPALAVAWSVASGAGSVTFEHADSVDTRATFTVPGTYVLRLSASDGELSTTDSVQVTVLPVPNESPVVDAGADQTITLPADALLDGSVSDDGRPSPATLAVAWSVDSGPGPVTFEHPDSVDTRAAFLVPGTYVLRLTASDGMLSAGDSMRIVVEPPLPIERRIADDNDDAEEKPNGHMSRDLFDLDLVQDAGEQTVGLRFTDLAIPPGATITTAYLQFETDETRSGAADLILRGEAADNPGSFTSVQNGISSRPRTTAAVGWSPAPWTLVGAAGPNQRTPDLAAVIQEVVARPGWASGNALVIIVTGSGERVARSREGDPSGAALLHVEYLPGVPSSSPSLPSRMAPAVPSAGRPPDPPLELAAAVGAPAPEFALHRVSSLPAGDGLQVEFSLAGEEPAALELIDVAGRRVLVRDLKSLGAGRHQVALRTTMAAGIYLVRLTQAHRVLLKKAVVLR